MTDTPQITDAAFGPIDPDALFPSERSSHPPRILILYGSLRERSFSRFAAKEAARILTRFGAEVQTFDPRELPAPDSAPRSRGGGAATPPPAALAVGSLLPSAMARIVAT